MFINFNRKKNYRVRSNQKIQFYIYIHKRAGMLKRLVWIARLTLLSCFQ